MATNILSTNVTGPVYEKGVTATTVEAAVEISGQNLSFTSNTTSHMSCTYTKLGQSVVFYEDETDSDEGYAVVATVSAGETITYGTPVNVSGTDTLKGTSCAYDTVNDKVLTAWAQPGGNHYGSMTVGTISGTGASATMSFGSHVQTNSGGGNIPDGGHLSRGMVWVGGIGGDTTNRLVLAMRNDESSTYGRAAVVTISGTTPTAGTWANFTTAGQDAKDVTMAYVGSGQVVVAYGRIGTSSGLCRVGTITGGSTNTIVWSTNEYAYATTHTDPGSTGAANSIAYDQNAGKFIIAYIDGDVNVRGRAIVGTVSGTGASASISFGTEQEFTTGSDAVDAISVVYHEIAQKSLISYNPNGSSNLSRKVATISGTNVSFGSDFSDSVVGSNPNSTASTYDTVNKLFLIFWSKGAGGGEGIASDIIESTLTLDLATASSFITDLQSGGGSAIRNIVINNVNAVAPKTASFQLKVKQGSIPRQFKWSGGTLSTKFKWPSYWKPGVGQIYRPTVTTTNDAEDVYSFTTYDNGTTWYASIVVQAVA